jgi:hypothetical protein
MIAGQMPQVLPQGGGGIQSRFFLFSPGVKVRSVLRHAASVSSAIRDRWRRMTEPGPQRPLARRFSVSLTPGRRINQLARNLSRQQTAELASDAVGSPQMDRAPSPAPSRPLTYFEALAAQGREEQRTHGYSR